MSAWSFCERSQTRSYCMHFPESVTASERNSDWHFWCGGRGHFLFIASCLCYSCYCYFYIFKDVLVFSFVLFYFAPSTTSINKTIPGCFQEHWARIQPEKRVQDLANSISAGVTANHSWEISENSITLADYRILLTIYQFNSWNNQQIRGPRVIQSILLLFLAYSTTLHQFFSPLMYFTSIQFVWILIHSTWG